MKSLTDTDHDPSSDVIPFDEAVLQLADANFSVEFIATLFNRPVPTVAKVLSVRRKILTPDDAQIAEGMKVLIRKAQKEAIYILDFGPTEQKMFLIKALLQAGAKFVGIEENATEEEVELAWDQLMAKMRSGAIDAGVIDAAASSITKPTDNSG